MWFRSGILWHNIAMAKNSHNQKGTMGENQPASNEIDWMMQNHQVTEAMLLQVLVDECSAGIYRLSLFLLSDRSLSHQVTEEVIHTTVLSRHKYWGQMALKTWIYGFTVINCRKKAQKKDISAVKSLPQENGQAGEQYKDLEQVVGILNQEQQLLLLLRYADHLPINDIAYILKRKPGAIHEQLSSVRRDILNQNQNKSKTPVQSVHPVFQSMIQSEVDQLLDENERMELKNHLDGCLDCRSYATLIDELDTQLRSLTAALWPVPSGMDFDQNALFQKTNEQVKQEGQRRHLSISVKEMGFIGAIAALVVVLSFAARLMAPAPDSSGNSPLATRVGYTSGTALPPSNFAFNQGAPNNHTWDDRPWLTQNDPVTPRRVSLDFGKLDFGTFLDLQKASIRNSGSNDLSIVLHYWGWQGNPLNYLQPNPNDVNVLPSELASFVNVKTDLTALVRYGGDSNILKQLVAAGFPVIIETGVYSSELGGWAAQYEIVTGYSRFGQVFEIDGSDLSHEYQSEAELTDNWRALNYVYILVYPGNQDQLARSSLGQQADELKNLQAAALKSGDEILTSTTNLDKFYAWFNRGTNMAMLKDYPRAAAAFDEAFTLYQNIPAGERPERILWYQTRPYWAYYYTQRYGDLINLANKVINGIDHPALEESYFWRALAEHNLGEEQLAQADLQKSVELNPNFAAGLAELSRMKANSN